MKSAKWRRARGLGAYSLSSRGLVGSSSKTPTLSAKFAESLTISGAFASESMAERIGLNKTRIPWEFERLGTFSVTQTCHTRSGESPGAGREAGRFETTT